MPSQRGINVGVLQGSEMGPFFLAWYKWYPQIYRWCWYNIVCWWYICIIEWVTWDIERKSRKNVKNLGVFLDEHLSWEILVLQLYNSWAMYFSRFYYLFLKFLGECFTSNKLTLSTEKNFFIIHHSKRKQISPQYDYFRIKNSVIKRVNHVKCLGVFQDEHLSWETLI